MTLVFNGLRLVAVVPAELVPQSVGPDPPDFAARAPRKQGRSCKSLPR